MSSTSSMAAAAAEVAAEVLNETLPRGEIVFALARGVATVVTLSALTLVAVLLIIAEAVLMVVAEKIGLSSIIAIVLSLMFVVGHQMGVPFRSLVRVLVFLWAF